MAAAAGTLPWSGLPRSCRPGGHGSPALHPVENAAATVNLLARRMPGRDSIRQDEPHAANSRSIPRGISVSPARGLSPAWDALRALPTAGSAEVFDLCGSGEGMAVEGRTGRGPRAAVGSSNRALFLRFPRYRGERVCGQGTKKSRQRRASGRSTPRSVNRR